MLSKKRALITGASSGIGRAITETLLAEGLEVYGLCRQVENLPAGAKPLRCDLTKPEEVQSAFAQLDQLDILINNAGLALLAKIKDGQAEDFSKMLQLNVLALTQCCQLALALFPEGTGHIVNVSSMSGHRVPATGGFYAPSKFAVRAITEALRSELRGEGSKVRVSSVSPGYVDTPLLEKYFKGREDKLTEARAKMRLLTAANVAASVWHILSAPEHVEIGDISLRSVDQP